MSHVLEERQKNAGFSSRILKERYHIGKEGLMGIILKWMLINEAQIRSNWWAVLNTIMKFLGLYNWGNFSRR
jgi:hypothetical protein